MSEGRFVIKWERIAYERASTDVKVVMTITIMISTECIYVYIKLDHCRFIESLFAVVLSDAI